MSQWLIIETSYGKNVEINPLHITHVYETYPDADCPLVTRIVMSSGNDIDVESPKDEVMAAIRASLGNS